MKKIFVILLCALVGLQSKAQEDTLSFGQIEYDGFKAVTKGAHWADRPEAKKIFESNGLAEMPENIVSYKLKTDCFARFSKKPGEHNSRDINYIVLPKGTLVYKKDKQCFLAICGNELVYLKPVESVKVVEKLVEKTVVVKDTVWVAAKPQPEPEPETKQDTVWVIEKPKQVVVCEPRRHLVVCQPPRPRPQFWGYVRVAYRGTRQIMPPPQQQPPRGYMGGGRTIAGGRGYMGGGNTSNGNQGYMGGGNTSQGNNGNQGGGRGF